MENELVAKKNVTINAPVSKVWSIITTDESVSIFMLGMKPQTDWNEGSSINWIGRHEGQEHNMAKGIIKELLPQKKLQYTFFYGGYGHADIPTHYQTVTFELAPIEGMQTNLTVQQGDYSVFTEGETYLKHATDFWEQAVIKIKEIAEQ